MRRNNTQGVNPILPLWEYIPDGEPHVFGGRIYLFGSHDVEGEKRYCAAGNYVGWSAPLSDPTNWKYEGIIYEASQDPDYAETSRDLYAPDVVCGNDGRYYMYYCLEGSGTNGGGNNFCKVAVCDTPVGRYKYLGYVRNPDGNIHNTYLMGDPGVINDGGTIRLYVGCSFSTAAAAGHKQGSGYEGQRSEERKHAATSKTMTIPAPGDPDMNKKLAPIYQMMYHRSYEQVADLKEPLMGANVIELEDDMMTVKGEPKRIIPGQFDTPANSSFFGHAFYEASSIRKINGKYYFIYSSENNHELCYAVSEYPDHDFVYGGTIISNGDIGYKGRKPEERTNVTADNHGSLECINGQWYIFYHRHTHKSTFSRQACAEQVEILEDGSIPQVECTSQGLNGRPLKADGEYPAPICCVLTNGHMPHVANTVIDGRFPYITNRADERYITDIEDGTLIGYKYFDFDGVTTLTLEICGDATGEMEVFADDEMIEKIVIVKSNIWTGVSGCIAVTGTHALYLRYSGIGKLQFKMFSFEKK